MFSIIAVVLGAAALIVYYKGVRNDSPGAAKLMTILVFGAVASAIIPLTPLQGIIEGRGVDVRYSHFELIGRQLRGELSRDDSVLILGQQLQHMVMGTDLDLDEALEDHARQVVEAVGSGARRRLQVAGIENLSSNGVDDWNEALAEYEGRGVRLILSQTSGSLPVRDGRDMNYDLESLASFEWDDAPLVAADVGGDYDAGKIRQYIQDGLLSAISLRPEDGGPIIGVGPRNLDQLQ